MPDNAMFYWNELVTHDVEAAKKFYTTVLGWTTEEMPMPSGQKYTVVKANGKPAAGIMAKPEQGVAAKPAHGVAAKPGREEEEEEGEEEEEEGAPSQWMAYIHVDDVDAAVAKAEAAGGEVCMPCFDVPGVGRIAMVADSTGAMIGLMTAKPA